MDKLYTIIDGEPVKLTRFDNKIGSAIHADMEAGRVVFELKPAYWSGSANNLPYGTTAVFISGSYPQMPVKPGSDIKYAGEVGVFRTDQGQEKSYRYLLVESGSQWFYGEEFKNFPEHYYSGSYPTGSIWEKIHPKRPTA